MNGARVTLVVPTFNRSDLLKRQLSYFKKTGFKGQIILADSSSGEELQATLAWLPRLDGGFVVRHRHLPGLSVAAAIRAVRDDVETPYVALLPDDDFLVPSGLEACARALDHATDHVAVHGVGVVVGSTSGRVDDISGAGRYVQSLVKEDSAADRVRRYLRVPAVSVFSTHRTDIWRKVAAASPSPDEDPIADDRAFSGELLPCCLTAAYGKIGEIEPFYLVRQDHRGRDFLPSWFSWFISEQWRPSYLRFRAKVAAAISEIDGTPLQECHDIVDEGFTWYIRRTVDAPPPSDRGHRLRAVAKSVLPRAVTATIRRLKPRVEHDYISLESLMDRSSPYYRDFRPIHDAIVGPASTP